MLVVWLCALIIYYLYVIALGMFVIELHRPGSLLVVWLCALIVCHRSGYRLRCVFHRVHLLHRP